MMYKNQFRKIDPLDQFCALPVKVFNEVSSAHKACIYLIQNTVKNVKFEDWRNDAENTAEHHRNTSDFNVY